MFEVKKVVVVAVIVLAAFFTLHYGGQSMFQSKVTQAALLENSPLDESNKDDRGFFRNISDALENIHKPSPNDLALPESSNASNGTISSPSSFQGSSGGGGGSGGGSRGGSSSSGSSGGSSSLPSVIQTGYTQLDLELLHMSDQGSIFTSTASSKNATSFSLSYYLVDGIASKMVIDVFTLASAVEIHNYVIDVSSIELKYYESGSLVASIQVPVSSVSQLYSYAQSTGDYNYLSSPYHDQFWDSSVLYYASTLPSI